MTGCVAVAVALCAQGAPGACAALRTNAIRRAVNYLEAGLALAAPAPAFRARPVLLFREERPSTDLNREEEALPYTLCLPPSQSWSLRESSSGSSLSTKMSRLSATWWRLQSRDGPDVASARQIHPSAHPPPKSRNLDVPDRARRFPFPSNLAGAAS